MHDFGGCFIKLCVTLTAGLVGLVRCRVGIYFPVHANNLSHLTGILIKAHCQGGNQGIRSIMESLGYIICRNLEAIDSMGLQVEQIRTMGGGSKSDIWNQIKADITGKTLYVTYSSQDTACLGAAILAGVAAGVFESIDSAVASMVKVKKTFEPNPNNREMYLKQYKKFKKLFDSMSELFEMDAEV